MAHTHPFSKSKLVWATKKTKNKRSNKWYTYAARQTCWMNYKIPVCIKIDMSERMNIILALFSFWFCSNRKHFLLTWYITTKICFVSFIYLFIFIYTLVEVRGQLRGVGSLLPLQFRGFISGWAFERIYFPSEPSRHHLPCPHASFLNTILVERYGSLIWKSSTKFHLSFRLVSLVCVFFLLRECLTM